MVLLALVALLALLCLLLGWDLRKQRAKNARMNKEKDVAPTGGAGGGGPKSPA